MPTAPDLLAVLGQLHEEARGAPSALMKFDVRKAHRAVPVAERGQGWQASRVRSEDTEIWVNLVG
eukprot:3980947-Lingulodinium_polyedra.AAC.1